MAVLCPVAGAPGKRVSPVTVRSLVRDEHLPTVEGREWFYCDLPDCDVVYFASDGGMLRKEAIKVRIGAKEKEPPRKVCYCFDHTVESIREEIERTGQSTAVANITAKLKAGECRCSTMNPKGTCCLGDVRQVVKECASAAGARAGELLKAIERAGYRGRLISPTETPAFVPEPEKEDR